MYKSAGQGLRMDAWATAQGILTERLCQWSYRQVTGYLTIVSLQKTG